MAGAVGAVAGRASHYLPKPLARRRLSGGAPPPQLVNVPVRRLSGEEAVVGASLDASLEELQCECQLAVGVAPPLQRICIQGKRSRQSSGCRLGKPQVASPAPPRQPGAA